MGYRVKSKNGIIFRRWNNNFLKDYILKGYTAPIIEIIKLYINILMVKNKCKWW